MIENDVKKLIDAAMTARTTAYAPYSKFRVGAAALCSDGTVYTGCNIENASYPCGICAERVAVSKAVSDGKTDIAAIAVIGSSAEKCTPCGVCRQFMYEFSPDMTVFCCDKGGNYDEHALYELLPRGFGAKSLK